MIFLLSGLQVVSNFADPTRMNRPLWYNKEEICLQAVYRRPKRKKNTSLYDTKLVLIFNDFIKHKKKN